MNHKLLTKNQSGQMFIISVIVLSLIIINALLLISGAFTIFSNSKYSVERIQAINLAEAGIDKAVASLNKTGGSYNGEAETVLGGGTYSITITNVDASTKKITATGYVPNKANSKSKKIIELQISKGVGIAFNYGVQVGEGGLEMENSATVNGSVYTNGNIEMSGSTKITGDAYVAGGVQPTPDQQTDCIDPNCLDFTFGRNTNAELDIAQSFKPLVAQSISKVALKLKRVGTPPNATVRLLGNNNGNPDKNNVLATGTLYSNLVTSQYAFIDVAFTSNPTLDANTIYWIVIDTSANSSNYWNWSLDSLPSYANGSPKWSPNFQASNPVWNDIPGDLGFKTYMGGVATYISGSNSATIQGNAYSNTITNMIIGKDAYYQLESGNTVSGQNCTNNTHCHPGSIDPVPQNMPISQANIDEWTTQAEEAGNLSAPDCNQQTIWGPGKYTGSITLDGTCKEKIKTPIWITGDLKVKNNSELKLDQSFGASSGAVIVDNFIELSNSSKLLGSGTAGSYLIGISEFSTKNDPSQRDAITISNNGNQGIVYADEGAIRVSNSNTMTEITAWKLELSNSVTINYDQGLAGAFFSSGPSGAYSVIKGSYQSK